MGYNYYLRTLKSYKTENKKVFLLINVLFVINCSDWILAVQFLISFGHITLKNIYYLNENHRKRVRNIVILVLTTKRAFLPQCSGAFVASITAGSQIMSRLNICQYFCLAFFAQTLLLLHSIGLDCRQPSLIMASLNSTTWTMQFYTKILVVDRPTHLMLSREGLCDQTRFASLYPSESCTRTET